MRLSLFKISILLVIIGASGTGIIFSESDKSYQFMTLKQTESDELSLYFEAGDIGYYKLQCLNFRDKEYFIELWMKNMILCQREYLKQRCQLDTLM